jgi:hypothetical protein
VTGNAGEGHNQSRRNDEPRTSVLYPGEKDIAQSVTPEAEAKSVEEFVSIVHAALPPTRIVMIGRLWLSASCSRRALKRRDQ